MVYRVRDLSDLGAFAAEAIKNDTVSFIAWQRDGNVITVNPQFYSLTGYSPESVEKMLWPGEFTTRESKVNIIAAMDEQDLSREERRQEETIIRADGDFMPVEIIIHRYQPTGSPVPIYFAFINDITERRRSIQTLAENEELFRALSETALAAILLVQNNQFVYVNPKALDMVGYSYAELKNMKYWDLLHPDFREEIIQYGDLLLHGKSLPARFEAKFVRKNGEERWCDMSIGPVMYKGKMAGVITALDITERKKSEKALKESEEKFRVLSELSPTAIFMYQGEILVYANPAGVTFTGYRVEDLVRKKFWEMVHPDYQEQVKAYGLARQRGEHVPSRYEIKYVTRHGESRWAEFNAGQIEYLGKPAGIVTAVDTTERKRTEVALNRAKLDAELYVDLLGHDINNMNQAALGFLELAYGKLASEGNVDDEDLQMLSSAVESLNSSSKLIDTVRKLQKERKGVYLPWVIDVNQIISEVQAQFAQVPGRNVRIEVITKYHCCVKANELMKDVFVNIVGNAIKHSKGDLEIYITTTQSIENGKEFCRVEIEDTGPGISDDRKRAIFDRSAKEKRRLTGKGLGLYLVRTLVDDFKGKIWVEDRVPGDYTKGCRFIVMLPANTGEPESTATEVKA